MIGRSREVGLKIFANFRRLHGVEVLGEAGGSEIAGAMLSTQKVQIR
jgi:hypothetical protein